MKKIPFLLAFLFSGLISFGQHNVNLVIFSEDLEPFYAYINGIKQNNKAETNVRVTNVSPNISLRIEFENKVLPVLRQNMSLDEGFEHTACIKRDKNNQMKLRYFGRVPIAEAEAENVPTVKYHTAEDAQNTDSADGQTSISSTTTTTYSGTQSNPSVNINMPGVSISMNTTVPQTQMQTTTSTTVTQSSTSTSRQSNPKNNPPQPQAEPAGCRTAMTPANFAKMKESVASKSFSDTKMSTARVATKNGCLSVAQVKEITKLFSMDDDKLAYAKFAYDYCVDKTNFYQVSEVFSFSTTQDELNRFLEQK